MMLQACENPAAIKKLAVEFDKLWRDNPEQATALTTTLAIELAMTGKVLGMGSKFFDQQFFLSETIK